MCPLLPYFSASYSFQAPVKKLLPLLFLLPVIAFGQAEDFRMLAKADSTVILHILQGIEETDNVSIATMKAYKPSKGYQRVFVWWRIGGVKENWSRGLITIDRSAEGVIGYSIDANRAHPKYHLLNDSEYISSILRNL